MAGIRQRPHGELGATDLEGVDVARTVIGRVITELDYQLEDVFNTDETGLYCRTKPSKTLAISLIIATCSLRDGCDNNTSMQILQALCSSHHTSQQPRAWSATDHVQQEIVDLWH